MAQKGAEFVHFDLEANKVVSYSEMKEQLAINDSSGLRKEAKVTGMSDKDANKAGLKMYFWCKGENVKNMTFDLQKSN
ncbi:hypothetical protein FLAN108750_09040 [Flavobacterium antarcticum]|uniref:hypothetical protein n=1 Tax=Flavobacterium antarcticum TaxID=271155 RepID=UPI0003B3C838|nr:hypothetical protein [Flavobacterium antarcticum]